MCSLSCLPSNSQLILTTTLYRRLGRSLKPSKDPVSCHSPALRPHRAYFSSLASGESAGTCLWYSSPVRSNDAAGCSAPCRIGTRPGTRSTAANTETSHPGLAQRSGDPNHVTASSLPSRTPVPGAPCSVPPARPAAAGTPEYRSASSWLGWRRRRGGPRVPAGVAAEKPDLWRCAVHESELRQHSRSRT